VWALLRSSLPREGDVCLYRKHRDGSYLDFDRVPAADDRALTLDSIASIASLRTNLLHAKGLDRTRSGCACGDIRATCRRATEATSGSGPKATRASGRRSSTRNPPSIHGSATMSCEYHSQGDYASTLKQMSGLFEATASGVLPPGAILSAHLTFSPRESRSTGTTSFKSLPKSGRDLAWRRRHSCALPAPSRRVLDG
jgi:hypothetical protein